METVIRNRDARRFSERRETHATLAASEKRRTERRSGFERRGNPAWRRLLDLFAASRKFSQLDVPLWALLSVFVLAFLYLIVNFGTPPSQYESGEVIVIDPSQAVSSDIVRSGYVVIETTDMGELGIKVQRLRIPRGMTVPEALTSLHNRYPGLEVDANIQIRPVDPS